MFLHALSRGIIFALQSFWRNVWLSIATIFVIFLTLVSVNFLIAVNVIADSAINVVKERIDVSIYLKPDIQESKIAELKTRLESDSQVKNVVYRSPADNLADFKAKHVNDEKIKETLDSLNGNPMGATLIIKAKNLKDYPVILRTLEDPILNEIIEEKNYDDNQLVIDRINLIASNIKRVILAISIIFIIISILIVFNTVRIAIFTHQNEIAIMKLVGASNWFIRFPFVFESILAGLFACILAMFFIYPLLSFTQGYIGGFFGGADFNIISYFNANFFLIWGAQLLGIIVINAISSSIALSKYLKV